jgi:Rod binding domain-containing protein
MQVAAAQNSPAAKDPRLQRSAHDFEASLMAELLKPLQETDGLTGEDSGGGAGSGGALGEFASESLARAISERGGFGIADRILRQLNTASPGKPRTDATGSVSTSLKLSGKPPI